MDFSELNGKTAFITGAASGIGYQQAIAFLKNGANVYALDRTAKGLRHIKELYPSRMEYTLGDITNDATIKEAVTNSIANFQQIDILVNTAGILDDYAPTLETHEMLWDKVMHTNVKGMYMVTNSVLPYMLKEKSGIIINMASIAGLVAGGGGAAYTTSKHAIVGYTKQLAYDYARAGIRANALAPGAIQTPMNEADFQGDAQTAEWVASETPAGRWAQAEEIAEFTLFLASSKASYMHGATLPIDGGWTVK